MPNTSLTLNPAALTRSLRHAGHPVANTSTVAPGAVRVQAALGAAGRDAQIRRLAAELVQRGYEVAVNAGRTAVTITLPEAELAEPVELAGNPGVMLIDPRTPLAAEHLADAAREVEVIIAETGADVIEPGRTMTDEQREVLVELVRDEYVAIAADNRQADLEEFVAEARSYPAEIAEEWLTTAAELKIVADPWDAPDADGLVAAITAAAEAWARSVTAEQLEVAFYAPTHKVGTRVTHRTGSLGTVVGPLEIVHTRHGDEVVVTVAFDEDETERRHPSTVTPVE